MFTSKKDKLFDAGESKTATATEGSTNAFVNAGNKKAAKTRSGNGALKFSTTGNDFVDQFGKMGSYKTPRSYADVSSDMSKLWAVSPKMTIAFTIFLRMITRVVSFFDGTRTASVQRGSGLRHEGILRMMWLHVNHPDVFWKNISIFISAGAWKDVIAMLSYDLQYNGWDKRLLDWDKMGKLILAGLENEKTVNLVKKYLPSIKSNKNCKTIEAQADNMIGKWICSLLFGNKDEKANSGWNYKKYRKLKSSGNAHQWQQLISQGKHNLVNFDTVHGRALAQLVSGKYISNQGLEKKYEAWIDSKPVARFTGYVNELFANITNKLTTYQIKTINAQFAGLVETAQKNAKIGTSMIVVRDTSSSMDSTATGTKQTCFDIAKALALFFSSMLPKGAFANSFIEFNSNAKMHQWKGSTPVEKWRNDHCNFVGSTDFLSVIRLFAHIKSQGVSESEFPTGIICISDSEFNPASLGRTNVEAALLILMKAGFSHEYVSNFKIVLWNLQSNAYGKGTGEKFETYGGVPNVYYFSGYDGSIIAFLTGVEGKEKEPSNATELVEAALDQEIMEKIEI